MKKILFATDFSEASDNAFEYLKGFIGNHAVQVDLMHVYNLPVSSTAAVDSDILVAFMEEHKSKHRSILDKMQDSLHPDQRGVTHVISGVYPSTEIAEIAEDIETDLVVMAMRRHYSLLERILGTTTANAIQKSRTNVLAIPNGSKYEGITTVLLPTDAERASGFVEANEFALHRLVELWKLEDTPSFHILHVSEDEGVTVTYRDRPFAPLSFTVSHASSVHNGIIDFMRDRNMDMIAVNKVDRQFWERLFHSSMTRKLLYESRRPLLVYV